MGSLTRIGFDYLAFRQFQIGQKMYSVIVNGKVLDHQHKKINDFISLFYIGDIYVGQIYKMKKSWSVVSKTPNKLCPINGLKTKLDACELLLKLEGYH